MKNSDPKVPVQFDGTLALTASSDSVAMLEIKGFVSFWGMNKMIEEVKKVFGGTCVCPSQETLIFTVPIKTRVKNPRRFLESTRRKFMEIIACADEDENLSYETI